MKVLVNLGFGWAVRLDGWNEKYLNKEGFDKLPYGYCWVENENVKINYIKLNKIEKMIFLNCKTLLKAYFYIFKVPIVSMKHDVIWTHSDRDGLYYGFLKSLPILKKYIPKNIANIIWLTDSKLNSKQIKRYASYLEKIEKITILSYAQKNILINKFKVDKSKIEYITYGLNKEIYSDTEAIDTPTNCKFENGYILMVGTDRHRDVELFKLITANLPDEKFVFATNNPEYMNQVYENNVSVMKCNLREMKFLYKNAKFLIMPLKNNTHASGCTTLIEAGLQKKSIITNYMEGLDDYFIKGKTAEVIMVSTLENYIKSIHKMNDYNYRCNIENNAFDYFYNQQKFDSKEYAKNFLRLSYDLLK